MGKIINFYGLKDKDVGNHLKIIVLAAKCVGWGVGFPGKDDGPINGLIVGEQEFGETILHKLTIFDEQEQSIEMILNEADIPSRQFEGELLSLDDLDDENVDDHIKIIAMTAKAEDWEIGFPGKENRPFTGLILGEKEFVKTLLQKLNIFDHLFEEKK